MIFRTILSALQNDEQVRDVGFELLGALLKTHLFHHVLSIVIFLLYLLYLLFSQKHCNHYQ